MAAVAAAARQATLRRKATAARAAGGGGVDNETCVVCVGPVVAPVELPCGHAYCGACLAELRTKKVAKTCRMALPPGLEGLFDLGYRAVLRIEGMVVRGELTWNSLPKAEQEEVEDAIAMLTEAGAQGHADAGYCLGVVLEMARKDINGAEAAYRAAIAAEPGHAEAHVRLGTLLQRERKDIDGAEAAYRAGIAAEPGHAEAHLNLGYLLTYERKDINGARAACSTARVSRQIPGLPRRISAVCVPPCAQGMPRGAMATWRRRRRCGTERQGTSPTLPRCWVTAVAIWICMRPRPTRSESGRRERRWGRRLGAQVELGHQGSATGDARRRRASPGDERFACHVALRFHPFRR